MLWGIRTDRSVGATRIGAAHLKVSPTKASTTEPFWGSNICEICCEDIVDGNPLVAYMSTCGGAGLADVNSLRSEDLSYNGGARGPVNLFGLNSIRLSRGSSRLEAGTHYVGQARLATVF
jgi:hypothetical protein